jgi:DNA-binding response OmpR family regulator
MRILLIDDDEDDQTLFCEAVKLISPNIQCDVASNGQQGLIKLNSYTQLPAAVFLDINMPILDGTETFKIIKSTPRLASLAVTIYSTSNSQDEVRKFLMMGAGYITKPNSFDELVKILSKPILRLAQERLYALSAR